MHVTSREEIEVQIDSSASVSPAPLNNRRTTKVQPSSRNSARPFANGYRHEDTSSGAEIPIDPLLQEMDGSGPYHQSIETDHAPASYHSDAGDNRFIMQTLTQQSRDIQRISESLDSLQTQMEAFTGLVEDMRDSKARPSAKESALVKSLQSAVNDLKKGGVAGGDTGKIASLESENDQLKKRLETLADLMSSALSGDSRRNSSEPTGSLSGRRSPDEGPAKGESKRLSSGVPRRAPWKPGTAPGPNMSGTKRKFAEQYSGTPAKRSSSLRHEVRPENEIHDTAINQTSENDLNHTDQERDTQEVVMTEGTSLLAGVEDYTNEAEDDSMPLDPALSNIPPPQFRLQLTSSTNSKQKTQTPEPSRSTRSTRAALQATPPADNKVSTRAASGRRTRASVSASAENLHSDDEIANTTSTTTSHGKDSTLPPLPQPPSLSFDEEQIQQVPSSSSAIAVLINVKNPKQHGTNECDNANVEDSTMTGNENEKGDKEYTAEELDRMAMEAMEREEKIAMDGME